MGCGCGCAGDCGGVGERSLSAARSVAARVRQNRVRRNPDEATPLITPTRVAVGLGIAGLVYFMTAARD